VAGAAVVIDVDVAEIEQERQDEERDGELDGGFAEDGAGFRAEGGLGHAAAQGRANAAVFGALHENEEAHDDGHENQNQYANGE
jgi:hypothetical protein